MVFLVDSIQNLDKTELLVYSRDKNNNKSVQVVSDFYNYFYVLDSEEVPTDRRIHGVQKGFTSINGEKVKKVIVYNHYDIKELKEMFTKHFEADIPITQRYIIDKLGEVETSNLRILYLDIETNSHNDFPDMIKADQEIISVALTDSYTGKSKLLIYKPESHKVQVKATDVVKVFRTEEELLDAVIHFVKSFDPDVISGWNVIQFDLNYMIKRMKLLGVDFNGLSPVGFVRINSYGDVKITGRILIDMMEGYKHFRISSNQGKAESYSLEFTGQEVLGAGKVKHSETFRELWMDKPDKLIEYNIRDTEMVHKINEKLRIISFFDSIRAKACSNMESIYHTSVLVDGLLLNVTRGNPVLPSKHEDGGAKYDGAFVFAPVPGVYDYVLALDIKSMYPSIIKTFNMGYETFDKNGEIKIANGIAFKKEEGFIPGVLTMLAEERAIYKKRAKTAKNDNDKQIYHFRQYAVKVLANSIYGYLGFPKSRLYKKEVAFAVTHMGQRMIKRTAKVAERYGHEVVYGDTDSVYVKSKKKNKLLAIKEAFDLIKIINGDYKMFAKEHGSDTCFLEMEFEKAFGKILFAAKRGDKEGKGAKKRYAYKLFWKDGDFIDGDMEVSGFDLIRSDTPRIAKIVQETVLRMALDGEKEENVFSYLNEVDKKIRSGEISVEEIGFPKGITENLNDYKSEGPVIQGAKYSNSYLGTRFGKGSKPKFVYIKGVPNGYPDTPVLTFEDEIPDGFIIDYDKMNERIFEMKLKSIFEAAGWKWKNINSNQSSMEVWL